MNNDFKIVILAIFDKNNFPHKATADIHGKPMIQHVYDSAKGSGASEIVIATDSTNVGMAAEDFGATVCMLIDDNLTGTDRLAEVVDKMGWGDDTIVVNFPGDAPLTPSTIIKQVAENLISESEADCATLYSLVPLKTAEKPYTINLVTDNKGFILYFSRCPIPHQMSDKYEVTEYKNYIELIAYRAGLLRIYRNLPESELDWAESIDEFKLLYNGMKIHAAEANSLIGQRVFAEKDIDKVKIQIAPGR